MKTIVIIGAGHEQVPAYRIARSKGLCIVGTDINPNAPAFKFADHALFVSTRDAAETCRVVTSFARRHEISGVMTIANDVPYTVAKVAEALSLPCASSSAILNLSDKVKMKRILSSKGISTPFFEVINSRSELKAAFLNHSPPLVLKPSDGRGSRGVLYLEEETSLGAAYDYSKDQGDGGSLLLEEYWPGPQLSVEGVFLEGKFHCVAFADRNYSNLPQTKPYIIEDGGTLPTRFDDFTKSAIEELVDAAARAMGITWGPVKADIVLSSQTGEPAIIELAGRLSGNYFATHHIPFSYGVDLVSVVIDLSLADYVDPARVRATCNRHLGVRYFFPSPGKIEAISGVDSVKRLPYVHKLILAREAGQDQPPIRCHPDRAGTVMTHGSTYEQATERAVCAASQIHFDIVN